jgi:hypothetical protein
MQLNLQTLFVVVFVVVGVCYGGCGQLMAGAVVAVDERVLTAVVVV